MTWLSKIKVLDRLVSLVLNPTRESGVFYLLTRIYLVCTQSAIFSGKKTCQRKMGINVPEVPDVPIIHVPHVPHVPDTPLYWNILWQVPEEFVQMIIRIFFAREYSSWSSGQTGLYVKIILTIH